MTFKQLPLLRCSGDKLPETSSCPRQLAGRAVKWVSALKKKSRYRLEKALFSIDILVKTPHSELILVGHFTFLYIYFATTIKYT